MKKKNKTVELYNPVTNDRWRCHNYDDVQLIDGVEFIKVVRYGHERTYLMRKDSLKKATNTPR